MNETLIAFLLGGAIIGSARLISSTIGPEYAALVGGLPTGLMAPFFLSTDVAKRKLMWGYFLDSFVMIAVLAGLYILVTYTDLHGILVSIGSLMIWAAVLSTVIYFTKYHKKK
jgi:hypothetical protein